MKETFSKKLNNINKMTAEFIIKQMLSQLKHNKNGTVMIIILLNFSWESLK